MHRAHAVGADALCALGRPKEALARADESIRIDPNGPCPRMARGTIMIRSGRRAEGIRPYEISATRCVVRAGLRRQGHGPCGRRQAQGGARMLRCGPRKLPKGARMRRRPHDGQGPEGRDCRGRGALARAEGRVEGSGRGGGRGRSPGPGFQAPAGWRGKGQEKGGAPFHPRTQGFYRGMRARPAWRFGGRGYGGGSPATSP